ncbi:hypothetical protein ACQP2F_13615 [Actinoplanes sp. CA-030573]|uniref:hypothetical protein n=1 Tax=Actinoplanes sp. CA-030573 TaxID=3239898 RepID=UPI003D943963
MPDNPNRPEEPSLQGLEGPARELKASPEMQQRLDQFRAMKEARQDASEIVDHRKGKAMNDADQAAGRQRGETAAALRKQQEG